MAGVVLGVQSSLPGYFKGGAESKLNPVALLFEKELGQVLGLVRKIEKKLSTWEEHQKT